MTSSNLNVSSRVFARPLCLALGTMVLLAGSGAGCRTGVAHGGRSAPAVAAARDALHEPSVKPGINDPYKNANVQEWVERFEGESREIFQQRHAIVEAMGLRPGAVVADIGAGTGLFTILFAEAVGPDGKVLAVEIVPEFIELIRKRARERGLRNIQTVLCAEDSVLLPADSIDLAFVCDTYHHFEYPRSTLASIHRALQPGGELMVIDFERIPEVSRQWVLDHVRAGKDVVVHEIEAAGFTRIDPPTPPPVFQENYFLRFRKKS